MGLTTEIDNYPGFPEGVDGFTLGQKMEEGAERFGAKTVLADVRSVELAGDIKTVHTSEGDYEGRTVVIATGATPRKLGVPGEQELTGRGVSYCAACDGMFYRGKDVVVVGGGNSAAHDASILARICKSVTLVHRRDTLRATKIHHCAARSGRKPYLLLGQHRRGDRIGRRETHRRQGEKCQNRGRKGNPLRWAVCQHRPLPRYRAV